MWAGKHDLALSDGGPRLSARLYVVVALVRGQFFLTTDYTDDTDIPNS